MPDPRLGKQLIITLAGSSGAIRGDRRQQPRTTPLSLAHLANVRRVTNIGSVDCPPVSASNARPQSIDETDDRSAGSVFALFADSNCRAHLGGGQDSARFHSVISARSS